jgi:hypothetical protein
MTAFLCLRRLAVAFGAGALVTGLMGAPVNWVDDTFADFAQGQLEESGQNLYAARDGSLRAIHRFDLNQDGWIDLLFNGTHDYTFDRTASVGTPGADGISALPSLDVKGSLRVVVEDLNRDGFPDAVFLPNDNWVDERRFLTIAWGGPDGWSNRRLNGALPVQDAKRLAVGDLDQDGWPDIAVLGSEAWLPGQPAGRIVRIYWGTRDGFLLSRRSDLGVPEAIDLKIHGEAGALVVLARDGTVRIFAELKPGLKGNPGPSTELKLPAADVTCLVLGDLNRDGRADLVVGSRSPAIYGALAQADGKWGPPTVIAARRASDLSLGDLDGDGRADLVASYFEDRYAGDAGIYQAQADAVPEVSLLWGGEAGFAIQSLDRPEFSAVAASAIGDLDGDGRPDVALARNRSAGGFFVDSWVLRNRGERNFAPPQGLATAGAADVAIAPARPGAPGRLVVANAIGATTLEEKVDSFVYWGGPDGFDLQRRWTIPGTSGFQATAADLNADGFVDIVAPYFGHSSALDPANPLCGLNIFWGSAAGFGDATARTVLRETGILYANVADLNQDGYLDLVAGQQFPPAPGVPQSVIIYYGGADGFSPERRVAVPCPGRAVPIKLADLNRDGWLDIVTSSRLAGAECIRIFHGSAHGFSAEAQDTVPFFSALDLELADLDGDGRLDLIASARADVEPTYTDLGIWIFWSNPDGHFRSANAQWLPGVAVLGQSVADFDGDGYLDLMCPSYHGGPTRDSLPNILYWGGKDGFSADNKTEFMTNAASDTLAADFDQDGKLDLAIVVHTSNGGHHQNSKVYYNDGRRFRNPRTVDVPAVGPHWMWGDDIGNIRDRRPEQTYVSRAWGGWEGRTDGRLAFTAEIPPGGALRFEVRSAPDEAGLAGAAWAPVAGGKFQLPTESRWLQYRATFVSRGGDGFPVLERVEISAE